MAKIVDMPVKPVEELVEQAEKPTIILDKILSHEDPETKEVFTIHFKGDLEYMLSDTDEYLAKLKDARGIPQDIANIPPDARILDTIELLPEVVQMPVRSRTEQEARNKKVLEITREYFAKLTNEANKSAIILAMSMSKDNVFNDEPQPYPKAEVRERPGLITLPAPEINLNDQVERRLKQILDRVIKIPGAMKDLTEAIELMSIDIRRRLQVRDKDSFRAK